MKNKAFTLIELLVVILIIGILAAIALPQYQKAVLKSRLSEQVINLKTLDRAQRLYYLNNGKFTRYVENLDIQAKVSFCGDYDTSICCSMPSIIQGLVFAWQGYHKSGHTYLQCLADVDNSEANTLCQSYQKQFGGSSSSPDGTTRTKYILNPV